MEQKDTIVFAFGRFNPPTVGHEKLIKKVASVMLQSPIAPIDVKTIDDKINKLEGTEEE